MEPKCVLCSVMLIRITSYNVCYTKLLRWLSLDSTSGTVPGTDSVEISATCDASELDYGVYTADITVTSNDVDEPIIVIPVTFTVADVLSAPENTAVVTATASEDNLGWDSYNFV